MKPVKLERHAGRKVTAKPSNRLADRLVFNLMQPRRIRGNEDWDALLKRAMAKSAALHRGEGQQLHSLVSRIADLYERQGHDFSVGGSDAGKQEWIDWVVDHPARIASTFRTFGRYNNSGIFTKLASEIGTYSVRSEEGEVPLTREDVGRYMSDPDSVSASADAYYLARFGRPYGYEAGKWEQISDNLTDIERADAAGNIMAAGLGAARFPGSGALGRAADLGPVILPLLMGDVTEPEKVSPDRPEAERWYPAANTALDYVELRSQVSDMSPQSAEFRDAVLKLDEIDQQLSEQVSEAGKQIPYDDQVIQADWHNVERNLLSAANSVANRAMAPHFMALIELGQKYENLPGDILSGRVPRPNAKLERQYGGYTVVDLANHDIKDDWVLAEDFGNLEAGTPMTSEVRQQMMSQGASRAPVLRDATYGHIRSHFGPLADLYVQLKGAQHVRSEWSQALRGLEKGYSQTGKARRASVAGRMARLFEPKSKGQRLAKLTGAMRRSMTRAPGLAKLYRTYQTAKTGLASRLPRMFRFTRPTGRAARALKLRGAAGKMLRSASRASIIAQGTNAWFDAAEGLTEHGVEKQQLLNEQFLRATSGKSFGQNFTRFMAAIPEAVFWDDTYLKGALGTFFDKQLGSGRNTAAIRQAIRREQLFNNNFNSAIGDLRRALPHMDDFSLHGMAEAMAIDRTVTIMDPKHRRKYVSRAEDTLMDDADVQALPENVQNRVRQLIRATGPEEFMTTFFMTDPKTGEVFSDKAAWASLLDGVDNPLPLGYGKHNAEVQWTNRYERYRTEVKDKAFKKGQMAAVQAAENIKTEGRQKREDFLARSREKSREFREMAEQSREEGEQRREASRQRYTQHRSELQQIEERAREQRIADEEAMHRLRMADIDQQPAAPAQPPGMDPIPAAQPRKPLFTDAEKLVPDDMAANVASQYGVDLTAPTLDGQQPGYENQQQPVRPAANVANTTNRGQPDLPLVEAGKTVDALYGAPAHVNSS